MITELLETAMKAKGFSTRQAAKQIGVSHMTIVRALHGEIVDLDTLLKISDWLHVLPSTLLNSISLGESKLASQIAVVLEREPELKKVFLNALMQVQEEKIDPQVIKEIAAYAAFRLNLEKPNKQ